MCGNAWLWFFAGLLMQCACDCRISKLMYCGEKFVGEEDQDYLVSGSIENWEQDEKK